MSEFFGHLWQRIKAVPLGIWAALAAAGALLWMYLRGRRLEAEIARAKLREDAARAAAESAKSEGRAQTHLEKADEHASRADLLEKRRKTIQKADKKERKRLSALHPDEVTAEFLKLAKRKKVQR